MPHLKVLLCGINASRSQWCGCIFILCYTHLKSALLLHKQGLVATGIATTVGMKNVKFFIISYQESTPEKIFTNFEKYIFVTKMSSLDCYSYPVGVAGPGMCPEKCQLELK